MKPIVVKLVTSSLAIVFLFCMLRFVITVRQVTCTIGDMAESCPSEIANNMQVLLGQPLLFSDLPAQVEAQIATEPYTVTRVTRLLPSTARVELMTAEYQFGLQGNTRSFTITSNGAILERPVPTGIPAIHFSESLIPETELPSDVVVHTAESTLNTLQSLELEYIIIDYVSEQELRIELRSSGITAIVDPAHAEEHIKTLQLILISPQLQEIDERVTELDMRFKLPVIRTETTVE